MQSGEQSERKGKVAELFSKIPLKWSFHPQVLMVEDSLESQVIVETGLRDWDVDVDLAEDGYEAVECFLQGPRWDLVILDWKLPGFNGLKALAYAEEVIELDPRLQNAWDDKKTPVVLYSAEDIPEEKFENFEHFRIVDFAALRMFVVL